MSTLCAYSVAEAALWLDALLGFTRLRCGEVGEMQLSVKLQQTKGSMIHVIADELDALYHIASFLLLFDEGCCTFHIESFAFRKNLAPNCAKL